MKCDASSLQSNTTFSMFQPFIHHHTMKPPPVRDVTLSALSSGHLLVSLSPPSSCLRWSCTETCPARVIHLCRALNSHSPVTQAQWNQVFVLMWTKWVCVLKAAAVCVCFTSYCTLKHTHSLSAQFSVCSQTSRQTATEFSFLIVSHVISLHITSCPHRKLNSVSHSKERSVCQSHTYS